MDADPDPDGGAEVDRDGQAIVTMTLSDGGNDVDVGDVGHDDGDVYIDGSDDGGGEADVELTLTMTLQVTLTVLLTVMVTLTIGR